MSAYTRFDFPGAIATSILPSGDLGIPWPSTRDHLPPPSCVTNTPLPGPPLNIPQLCMTTSHVPAISVLGSAGSIVRPEQPLFGSTNKDLAHVFPPSVVLKTPRSCWGPVSRPA